MVGGGIGAATILADARANDATTIKAPIAQAQALPKPAQPAGTVEQVAAKVMPSVVKLKIDMGGRVTKVRASC